MEISYAGNFAVYTLAMSGLMMFAFVVYKKFTTPNRKQTVKHLQIEELLNLSPMKTLYVVKIRDERFLIASDKERTALISKLNNPSKIEEAKEINLGRAEALDGLYMQNPIPASSKLEGGMIKKPVLKELLSKLPK